MTAKKTVKKSEEIEMTKKKTTKKGRLASLVVGKRTTFYCANYIYAGRVASVADGVIELREGELVYDTGSHNAPKWADSAPLPPRWYLRVEAVEGFGQWK